MRSSSYFKTISQILILAMLHLCWLISYGYAEMVPTESATQVQDDRQRILDLLNRQEVAGELEKYGISKVEATARINSLTDKELGALANKINRLPAGGANGSENEWDDFNPMEPVAYVLLIILAVILLYYFISWAFDSDKGSVSSPVEEDCDPGMESCDYRIENR